MKIANGHTHDFSKNEFPHELWNDGEGHTEDGQEKVTDAQVQQEHVGDGPHSVVLDQSQDDQSIAHHTEYKDQGIQRYPNVPVLVKLRVAPHGSVVAGGYAIIDKICQR